MELARLLGVVVVFCSTIGCINAAESVLKIDFSNDGCNGVKYNANYSYGMRQCSDGSANMEDLASSINSLSNGALSVGSTDREYIDSKGSNYTIGTNDGGTRNLVVLDNVKCGSGLDKLLLNGDVKNPTSMQMNFNSASDMQLPLVKCNDMALLKFKIDNASCNDIGYMKGLEVDAPTGLFYNVPVKINGGKFNNAKSNLDDLCSVANKGLNNIKFANGGKYNFGIRYNIPGITDKLGQRGLKITGIEISACEPCEPHVTVQYNDKQSLNKLLNMSGPGTFVIDGLNPHDRADRVNRSPVALPMWKAMSGNIDMQNKVMGFRSPKVRFLSLKIQ